MVSNELRGKRLLVLGGSTWKEAIRDFADRYGIIIVAAGLYHIGIYEIADESYTLDILDKNVMIPFIKEKKIDGVYMGGAEPVIAAACQYVNELGLPCYCTKEQWDWLQDKRKFKELCIKHGLPVAPRYSINEHNMYKIAQTLDYPVIFKPADGCGSNGFSVCHDIKDVQDAYMKAAQNSPTSNVICEKYVKNDSVVVFYTFSNGKAYFSGIEDKYPVRYATTGSFVAGMHVFESNFVVDFRNRFEDNLYKVFNEIGICEGSLWIEVFHDGNSFFFNEVGFRYSGSVSIFPVDYFYNINQVGSDIVYALTGKSHLVRDFTLIPSSVPRKKKYCIFNVHILSGTIAQINGLKDISNRKECVFILSTKTIGDIIKESGSVGQIFAFIHFVYDDIKEHTEFINFIFDHLHVLDAKGHELINRDINNQIHYKNE